MRSRLMQYRSDPLMQNHSGVDRLACAIAKPIIAARTTGAEIACFIGSPLLMLLLDRQLLTLTFPSFVCTGSPS
jgi:hypothetical protein